MILELSDKEALERGGYVFVPKLYPEQKGNEIASKIGELLKLGSADAVHELSPLGMNQAPPNTYSGIYGYDAFPFHTDLAHWRYPPRYIMLRCLKGFREVPTLLVDGFNIVERVGKTALHRALVQPRRPVAGRLQLLRLLDEQNDVPMLRWDELFIRAASGLGEKGMERFKAAVVQETAIKIELIDEGDTLFVDNWRMLHARSPVPDECKNRSIERAYLGSLH